jgi:hypothetical protein
MQLSVLLSPSLNADWQQSRTTPEARALTLALNEHGVDLLAQHPGISDPELGRYYSIDIVNPATVTALRERLAQLPGVEAAFVKADAAPP